MNNIEQSTTIHYYSFYIGYKHEINVHTKLSRFAIYVTKYFMSTLFQNIEN